MVLNIYYIGCLIFLFVVLFGGKRSFYHSTILLVYMALNIVIIDVLGLFSNSGFIVETEFLIFYESVTAMLMLMVLRLDSTAWKQALLLALATYCHAMILFDLTVSSTVFSDFFYSYYEELITTIALLQMSVSKNGIVTAFRNLQNILREHYRYNYGTTQGCHTHYRSKG